MHHSSDESAAWLIEEGLAARVLCMPEPTPTPANVAEADPIYTRESTNNGGVLLELESVETPAGTVLRSLFKYPKPNQPRGNMIVGIALLSWPHVHARIHVEAVELGATGSREAAGDDARPILVGGMTRGATEQPTRVLTADDPIPTKPRGPMKANPSDDPKWDEKFPDHPLSRVRRYQRKILETLTVDGMQPCG